MRIWTVTGQIFIFVLFAYFCSSFEIIAWSGLMVPILHNIMPLLSNVVVFTFPSPNELLIVLMRPLRTKSAQLLLMHCTVFCKEGLCCKVTEQWFPAECVPGCTLRGRQWDEQSVQAAGKDWMLAIIILSVHNTAPSIWSAVKRKKKQKTFDPYCQISRLNIKCLFRAVELFWDPQELLVHR